MRNHSPLAFPPLELASPPILAVLTVDQAATFANLSRSTIRRAIASGELKAAKLGAAVRVRSVDLDAWLRQAAGSDLLGVVPTVTNLTEQI